MSQASASLPLPIGARLRVLLEEFPGQGQLLCGLARGAGGRTALEWSPDALRRREDAGANLAVRQAPLLAGVHLTGSRALGGLPGFLADSLPDSWGRLLVDRALRRRGLEPARLTGFDRLALVGRRGPGALTYEPELPLAEEPVGELELDRLAADAERILAGREAELLEQLERIGGSAGGSRPKAWVALGGNGRLRSGAHELQAGESGWLVKFRAPAHDPPDVAELELAYCRMAQAGGLTVAEPRLFEGGRTRCFASRRFDRQEGRRIHTLTAAGLLDVAAHEAVAADYLDLLKLTRHVTRSEAEVLETYRHAVFNVYAHNRDDHLRQFAFLRRPDGRWVRTPAYDLTCSPGPGGEHTLLVAGEGRHPTEEHLIRLAERGGVQVGEARKVRQAMREAVAAWSEHATRAGVGEATRAQVQQALR